MRRRSADQIRALVREQRQSRESVPAFCESRGLKAGTFYAWRSKYKEQGELTEGFCQLLAKTGSEQSCRLRLGSALSLELNGWSVAEIVDLVQQLSGRA